MKNETGSPKRRTRLVEYLSSVTHTAVGAATTNPDSRSAGLEGLRALLGVSL